MKLKLIFFITVLSGLHGAYLAQGTGDTFFKEKIVDQWWTSEHHENKQDCDMRLLLIKSNEFECNCVNWANGFSGNKCGYQVNIRDGFFEIAMKNCDDKFHYAFMYGYLKENMLLLLLSGKSLALDSGLLAHKNWITFDKVVR